MAATTAPTTTTATRRGLACTDLDVTYRRREGFFGHSELPAVRGVSLAVEPGGSMGIVGESGSGKSTLARALVGLIEPAAGTVSLGGDDLWSLRARERALLVGRNVGVVFQDPRSSMNRRLTVGDVVRDPLAVHGVGSRQEQQARVRDLIEAVGLPSHVAERPVRRLSGGQLQRVAIARALALDPDIVVADEPTSALDVSVQAGVLNLLSDLRRDRGFGLLVISHDIGVIEFLADDMMVMYLGQALERGPAAEVRRAPLQPYTKALLSSAPTVHGARQEQIVLGGTPPDPSAPPSGCPFRTRCWKAEDRCAVAPVPRVGDDRHFALCVNPEHPQQRS
jgi:peptide/nickel transport system ATP-binding protein